VYNLHRSWLELILNLNCEGPNDRRNICKSMGATTRKSSYERIIPQILMSFILE